MLPFLRLMQLGGADSFLLESIFREEVWSHCQAPLSEDNERGVCDAITAGASEALAAYASSIDQDLAALRGGGLERGGREELAIAVRAAPRLVAAACRCPAGRAAADAPFTSPAPCAPPAHRRFLLPKTKTHPCICAARARQARLGEKEALDATLRFFEERRGTLPRLVYYQERRLKRLGLIDDEGRTTYDSFFKDGIA